MEPVQYFKDMLNISEGTIVDSTMEGVLGSAPLIGKAYQSYQMVKLNKRMKKNEQQLLIIKDKIERSENEVFYKSEVFPMIVKKLMEDDEDEKAKVIIDGFEHLIDDNLKQIEKVYHYYDVLSDLRFSDIMLFADKYMPYEKKKIPKLKINLTRFDEFNAKKHKNHKEGKALKTYQINKFIRLGLINDQILNSDDGNLFLDANKSYESRTTISDFGIQFLEFFLIDENDE